MHRKVSVFHIQLILKGQNRYFFKNKELIPMEYLPLAKSDGILPGRGLVPPQVGPEGLVFGPMDLHGGEEVHDHIQVAPLHSQVEGCQVVLLRPG